MLRLLVCLGFLMGATQGVTAETLSRTKMIRSVPSFRGGPKLDVAFAVFVTDIASLEWEDALRILAHSVKKSAAKSKHNLHLLALSPERLSADNEHKLLSFGFEHVVRKPIPVAAELVEGAMAREHMQRVNGGDKRFQFAMAEETIKYWGMALTDYDRVLVLDADTMILDPMDELMESDADFLGVYDHGLDVPQSTLPPTQGGFLLFRPNKADFLEVKRLTREGDWDGHGWKRSGIGYCYGGVGPDGLLAYHYNKDALPYLKHTNKTSLAEGISNSRVPGSRMHAVDRAIYDVVINDRLIKELQDTNKEQAVNAVKSAHFTGNCIKPWTCDSPRDFLCDGLFRKWWELRAEVEQEAGLNATTKGCVNSHYEHLKQPSS